MKKLLILFTTTLMILPTWAQVTHDFVENYFPGKHARKALSGANNLPYHLPAGKADHQWVTEELAQKLDSFVMITPDNDRFQKQSFTYTEDGQNLTLDFAYMNDSTGEWEVREFDEFLYNTEGYLAEEKYYEWDDDSARLVAYYYTTYQYDSLGLLSESMSYYWNQGAWEKSGRSEYVYNSSLKLEEVITSNWDEILSAWIENGKTTLQYDTDGRLDTEIYYTKGFVDWEAWNKSDYSYNSSGLITEIFQSDWSYDSSQWENGHTEIFTYDNDQNLLVYADFYWDHDSLIWVADDREQYTYDQNSNPVEIIFSEWNADSSRWENNERNTLNFDPSTGGDQLILPFDDETSLTLFRNGRVTDLTYYSWDLNDSVWVEEFGLNLYYSDIESSVAIEEIHSGLKVNVFPVPARDRITINIEEWTGKMEVRLMDMNGRILQTENISNKGILLVADLPRGFYLLKIINQNQEIFHQKIVLE